MNALDLEVFRAGDYRERGRWDRAALEQMAADYDPSLPDAPVTTDHAQAGPALGWVESLRRVGDVLVARLRDLDPGFAAMIRSGAFKKRSGELYSALRDTGRPYLRAVSFLGACPPAVKGLADVVFAEGEGEPARIQFDERESAGDAESAWETLREQLMASGRWLPLWEENGRRAFWESITDTAQRDWFAEFLGSMPEAVPTQPLGAASAFTEALSETIPSSSTRAEVSSPSVALHRRAVAFREAHPETSYSEALRAVARCA